MSVPVVQNSTSLIARHLVKDVTDCLGDIPDYRANQRQDSMPFGNCAKSAFAMLRFDRGRQEPGLTDEYSHSGISPTLTPVAIPAQAAIHVRWLPEICLPVNTLLLGSRLGMATISRLFERLAMMDCRLRGNDGGERGNGAQVLCMSMLMHKPCITNRAVAGLVPYDPHNR